MIKIVKGKSGPMLYGVFSNRYQDREREIITDLAHKDYIEWLNANPDAAPQLWIWHEEGSAFKNKAVWWAYDGAFLSMLWPLEQDEVGAIKRLQGRFGELGMSHGFQAEKRGGLILKYRTYEASILPKDKAANFFTNVSLMEDTKMDDKTLAMLASLTDEQLAKEIAQRQTAMAEALDDSGVATKDVAEPVAEPEIEPETVEVETETPTPIDESDIVALAEVVERLANKIEGLEAEVKSLKSAEQKRKAKAQPTTLKSVVARLAQSSIEKSKPVDGRTAAAKSQPSAPESQAGYSTSMFRGGA